MYTRTLLRGASYSIRTLADVVITVVSSALEGGAGGSGSPTDTQECTAVSYDSGGADAFQAGTSDPCP